MQREVKEQASFRDRWVPEAGAQGLSVAREGTRETKQSTEQPRPRSQKASNQAVLRRLDFTSKTMENHGMTLRRGAAIIRIDLPFLFPAPPQQLA